MKKTNKNNTLTPEQYIRQKARTLPLGQCYMNKNWFISGIAIGVVCRCHKMGTYTFGVFQLDTFCSGLIDCKIEFSKDKQSYDNIMAYLKDSFKVEPVTYQEVHNLIYGAIAFGEDAGFTAPSIYNLAKFLLEEDTEDIPLINYQYGRFGKHFLLADSIQELDEFMPHLIAHLGKENVLFGIEGSDRYFKGEDFYDSETRRAMFQIASKIQQQKVMPLEEYGYVHPQYPTELKLKHMEVKEVLYNPANRMMLEDEQIDQLMALPHEELSDDLQQILLYELGKTCEGIPEVDVNEKESAFLHALLLLGEVGNKESLSVVLETMCQKKDFYDYELGIILNEAYVPTLYKLGKDQLDKFYEFLQIPGLYTYARYLVFPAVVQIANQEPERREEVIDWFRNVLHFYAENLANNHCCDGSLIGLIATDLLRLQAEELLPELKTLFETGKVNEQCCGTYDKVVEMMKQTKPYSIQYLFDLKERYQELRNNSAQLIQAHNNLIAENVQAQAMNAPQEKVEEAILVEEETGAEKEETGAEIKETKASAKKTTKAKTTKKAAKTEEKADPKVKEEKENTEKKAKTTRTKKVSTAKKADTSETKEAKATKAEKTAKATKTEMAAKATKESKAKKESAKATKQTDK